MGKDTVPDRQHTVPDELDKRRRSKVEPSEVALRCWQECINALHLESDAVYLDLFFNALEQLYLCMLRQFASTETDLNHESMAAYMEALHRKAKITHSNHHNFFKNDDETNRAFVRFCHLRSAAAAEYETLFMDPNAVDFCPENANNIKRLKASMLLLLMIPFNQVNSPRDIRNNNSSYTLRFRNAIHTRFTSLAREVNDVHQKKMLCLYNFLVSVKREVENKDLQWERKGVSILGFIFPFLIKRTKTWGRKTPTTVLKLQKALAQAVPSPSNKAEFENVFHTTQQIIFASQHGSKHRLAEMQEINTRWFNELSLAERGKFAEREPEVSTISTTIASTTTPSTASTSHGSFASINSSGLFASTPGLVGGGPAGFVDIDFTN